MYEQILPQVGFAEAIKKGYEKICCFQGRARRSECWFFYLFTKLVLIIPVIIFISLFFREILEAFINRRIRTLNRAFIGFLILLLIDIIVSVPLLSLSVRILHDTGKSGLFLFLLFIPFIGIIVIFIFLLEDSSRNTNEYGPSPKYVTTQANPLLSNSQINSFAGNPYINP